MQVLLFGPLIAVPSKQNSTKSTKLQNRPVSILEKDKEQPGRQGQFHLDI